MPAATQRIRQYLNQFDLKRLFEELGWDRYAQPLDVPVDGQTYRLTGIAHKRNMAVFSCSPSGSGQVPDYATRRKIERQVARTIHEHLIIYVDSENTTQIWQWVKREPKKPDACREHQYQRGQSGEALIQKLKAIRFTLEEEGDLDIVKVSGRMRSGFDVDRVTKRFYDCFKKEHTAFLKFIKGIQVETDREWYASVMLNRLMFVYFIQKKGFLDGDVNYLPNRLQMMRQQAGNDRFHSFYRHFLLRLFHEGLGQQFHSSELESLLGNVPYLNGGLFDVHKLEADYPDIQIPDEAFGKIFTFFDTYQWHLDERPLKNDNEINPDVLGYIFEKYINQKQMGAYYTKEDITGYISQNTIVPFLFDAAQKKCRIAFEGEQSIWRLLQADPDRYIYEAVKKGVKLQLPPEIAVGLSDVTQRTHWNRTAPEEFALPTEIWREVVARRKRYEEIHGKLATGEIRSINDLITYNLDIRQFAQDVIENSEGPELLRAFYHAIEKVTVLDPTCGSGAFLFAALNILEPLYEACLDRMQVFLEELELIGVKHRPEKFNDFREVLAQVERHPNRRYFILKSIIVNNLYGVDIMEEAVEICKLRLFLKLAAQVDQGGAIDPLPDIDFNIQAGNTLVGYVRRDEVSKAVNRGTAKQTGLVFTEDTDRMARIDESAEIADRAFQRFHQMQTEHGMDPKEFAEAKAELRRRLGTLSSELDRYLAAEYGIDRSSIRSTQEYQQRFRQWQSNHQPFHWYTEFYAILQQGGFDVVIGNPPYVSVTKVNYLLSQATQRKYADIYAYVTLRCIQVKRLDGRIGLIVPLSITFSEDYGSLREAVCHERSSWFSSYDNIPASLFTGVSQRCTIWISCNASNYVYMSQMYRWRSSYRAELMNSIFYSEIDAVNASAFGLPKVGSLSQRSTLFRLREKTVPLEREVPDRRMNDVQLLFSPSARNFISVFTEPAPTLDAVTLAPSSAKNPGKVRFTNPEDQFAALAATAGEVCFWYWLVRGDGFDVTNWLLSDFIGPLGSVSLPHRYLLSRLGRILHERRFEALVFKKNAGKYVGNFNYHTLFAITRRSDLLFMASLGFARNDVLEIFDFVQRVLAINEHAGEKGIPESLKNKFPPLSNNYEAHANLYHKVDSELKAYYGFRDDELDFIINYDIKYRMGRDAGGAGTE